MREREPAGTRAGGYFGQCAVAHPEQARTRIKQRRQPASSPSSERHGSAIQALSPTTLREPTTAMPMAKKQDQRNPPLHPFQE